MRVYPVLLIIVFSLTTNIFSQVQFTPHNITTDAFGAVSVYAVDVDGPIRTCCDRMEGKILTPVVLRAGDFVEIKKMVFMK